MIGLNLYLLAVVLFRLDLRGYAPSFSGGSYYYDSLSSIYYESSTSRSSSYASPPTVSVGWFGAVREHTKVDKSTPRNGVVVLGMHRSGTSMLSGLLSTGLGYSVGGPLLGARFDNEKGFYERVDMLHQNRAFMSSQNCYWHLNPVDYDAKLALERLSANQLNFTDGISLLNFTNDPDSAPWLLKDPRLCLTLRTWLPLLSTEPAILFSYRHPLEVALSLNKRETLLTGVNFPLELGLYLWIVYNMRAVQGSFGLCRVFSNNHAIVSHPLSEAKRISKELTRRCGLPRPARELTREVAGQFVDPDLQRSKHPGEDRTRVLMRYNGCRIHAYNSTLEPYTREHRREQDLYLKAMRIYCDLRNGRALHPAYEWPDLPRQENMTNYHLLKPEE